MLKRKSQTFFIVLVAIAAIFTSTGALAECNSPECFTGTGCELSVVRGPNGEFPIVINSSNEILYLFPDDMRTGIEASCGGYPCTVFAYTYLSNDCQYSQLQLALPNPATYCNDDPWTVLEKSVPSEDWKDPEEGDKVTGWYVGDDSVRVLGVLPNTDGFFFITTNNVSAHPAPVMVKHGKTLVYGTLLAPNCWVPPPPVAVSSVSTTTPEGCTLTVSQTLTGPKATYECPPSEYHPGGISGTADDFDTDEVFLGFPTDGVCKDGQEVNVFGQTICLQAFKFLSDQAFGRVGENSTGWYYWNGKWYSYTY